MRRLALRPGLGQWPVSADEADATLDEARWALVQVQRLSEPLHPA